MIKIKDIIKIAKEAGKEILKIYEKDFSIDYKEDKSPLTEADLASNKIITEQLLKIYPDIPIISEENKNIPYEERKNWECFWLIDPLDGTKDFIKRNGEFTVNIALIKNSKPIMGVVYVPVKDVIYYASEDEGSYKQEKDKNPQKIFHEEKKNKDALIVVTSRSHPSQETQNYIEELKKKYKEVKLLSAGSSLKLCLVAENAADTYPRLGPTMEWDTAAAHAVVRYAGKKVREHDSDKEIEYNKENQLNNWFIVE